MKIFTFLLNHWRFSWNSFRFRYNLIWRLLPIVWSTCSHQCSMSCHLSKNEGLGWKFKSVKSWEFQKSYCNFENDLNWVASLSWAKCLKYVVYLTNRIPLRYGSIWVSLLEPFRKCSATFSILRNFNICHFAHFWISKSLNTIYGVRNELLLDEVINNVNQILCHA